VIEPEKYPFPKDVIPPHEATMEQALTNSERLGIPNMVFVQISTYGTDNTWLLDALKKVGSAKGRGIVVFNPEQIDSQTLQLWHNLGVRGVRLNLRSTKSSLSPADIRTVLHKYAEKLRPMKTWSIGLYADMKMLDHVQPLVSELGIKIVLEHLASPEFLPLDPARMPGWEALNRMMEEPRVYVKVSGPYLFSKDPEFKDLESLTKSLLGMRNGEGVVFASDWPHTQSRGFDAKPFLKRCMEWCNGEGELEKKLFRDNAKVLWDVQ
jgi:predicted TIM-barrel fold metal-dependent hydrolase